MCSHLLSFDLDTSLKLTYTPSSKRPLLIRELQNYNMQKDQTQQIETVLQNNLIKAGIQCAFICNHDGFILVSVNIDDKLSKLIAYAISTVADEMLVSVKSIADQMARLLGDKSNFSLLLHEQDHETILVNELTDQLLLVTLSGNEVSMGLLRIKVMETIEIIRKMIVTHEENLAGKTVEVLIDRILHINGVSYGIGKTAKMQNIKLLLPDNHSTIVGDYVFGKIVESRTTFSIGLMTNS